MKNKFLFVILIVEITHNYIKLEVYNIKVF
jgi:hypothetical protein